MTQDQRRAQPIGTSYAEAHSAIRWPYFANLAGWTILLLIGIWTAAINPNTAFVSAFGAIGIMLTVAFAAKNWPTGITIDADGIRIGGISSRPRLHRKNLPWADWQRRHVFFCPWGGVRRVAVITDKPALRDTRRLTNQETIRLGALTGPFTRAALLIEIDPERVVMPEFRERDTERQFWRYSHLALIEPSPVWYAPTRRPEALRAVLAQHYALFGGQPDPRLPAHFQLIFERADVTR